MKSLFLVVALVILAAAAAAVEAGSPYKIEKFIGNLSMTTFDGFQLPGNVFIPQPQTAGEKFPLVITENSWTMPDFEYALKCDKLAVLGFVCLEYETRGWSVLGISPCKIRSDGQPSCGYIDTAGPKDVRDHHDWVDFALARASEWHIQTSPLKIASCGISYGSGLSLLAAANDSRVGFPVAMSTWGNLTESLLPFGSPATNTIKVLVDSAKLLGHPSEELLKMSRDFFEYKNVSGLEAFGNKRSPVKYLSQLNGRKVPVFISQNQNDWFFSPTFIMEFWSKLENPQKMLLLNQGGHAEAEAFGLFDVPHNYVWQRAIRWMQYWLRGEGDILDEPRVQCQAGNTLFSEDYALFKDDPNNCPSAVKMTPLRLTSRGSGHWGGLSETGGLEASSLFSAEKKKPAGKGKSSAFLSQLNKKSHHDARPPPRPFGASSDSIHFSEMSFLTPGSIINDYTSPLGIPFDLELEIAPEDTALLYRTAPFAKDTLICGTPIIDVTVVPNSPKWQLAAYLYEVDLLDIGRLISWQPYSKFTDGVANQPYHVQNWKLRTKCTRFIKGHRLALGFSLYNSLFEQAGNSTGLRVAFEYGSSTTLTIPINPT